MARTLGSKMMSLGSKPAFSVSSLYARTQMSIRRGVVSAWPLSSAVTDTGPGVFTMMRQIVGEELKVPLESIQVEMLDSAQVVKDTGVRGSSSTRVHGSSALDAARRLRDEILKVAAQAMNTAPEELIIYDGRVTHRRAEQRMTYAEIARANGKALEAEGHYANMADGPEASLVAQVAEVENLIS